MKIRVYRQRERMKDKGKANALDTEEVSSKERCNPKVPVLLFTCWIPQKKQRACHMNVREVFLRRGNTVTCVTL